MADQPVNFPGGLRATQAIVGTLIVQNADVTDARVQVGAAIQATKLQRQVSIEVKQATGTDVVSRTEDAHIVFGATGVVVGVQVVTTTAPIGGDKHYTVDVQKSTGGGSFASLLTGVVTMDNSTTSRVAVNGTLVGSPTLLVNDIIRVIVAASGSTGSQGQGMVVTVTTREDPQ